MKQVFSLILSLFLSIECATAAIKTETIEYSDKKGTTMEGFMAYDDAKNTPQPGILIAHDWMGPSDFTEEKAKELAKLGYVAFAIDIYGKGVRPHNEQAAAKLAANYNADRALLRTHMQAALDKLVSEKKVDPHKIVVIGYCFGGTAALELARFGAPLVGTVSFHGGLSTPTPEDAKNIKGRVLILHGADDPHVPPKEVTAFKEEMKNAGVNMEFIAYPGAVHAFTNPKAGSDNSKGVAYNAEADKKSWTRFMQFLKEVF